MFHRPLILIFLGVFLIGLSLFSSPLFAQTFQYAPPIPVKTGKGSESLPNANNVVFFGRHPADPDSEINFKQSPSTVEYFDGIENRQIAVEDLLGAPGFAPRFRNPGRLDAMLGDLFGLCYENLLMNLICDKDILTDPDLNQESWSQMVADLRNLLPGENNIPNVVPENIILEGNPDSSPYDRYSLGSIVSANHEFFQSPPAICYDITAAEDWLACPVFGKIYIRLSEGTESHIGRLIPLQSPILIYRITTQEGDKHYQLVGYLANPEFEDYQRFDDPQELQDAVRGAMLGAMQAGGGCPDDLCGAVEPKRFPLGNAHFPMAIASGDFAEPYFGNPPPPPNHLSDIAVMSSATLSNMLCRRFQEVMQNNGYAPIPHQLNCSYGYIWVRSAFNWTKPRMTFDNQFLLIGPPGVYDIAAGVDEAGRKGEHSVLFAPSSIAASDANGVNHYYIYKYFERGRGFDLLTDPFFTTFLGKYVPPKAIEVTPPQEGFAPFKIGTTDINGDGHSDFALTWKGKDFLADEGRKLWKSSYSPFVSVFISQKKADGMHYNQFNIQSQNPEAQFAAVTFGRKEGQIFLVAGDQKRRSFEENFHAFVEIYPIEPEGIVNISASTVRASFFGGNQNVPGVADVTTNPNTGVIGSAMRDPFIRAPEGCNIEAGEVYSPHWFGMPFPLGGQPGGQLWDANRDGIPNRCECPNVALLGENNDNDRDEVPDECDSCPGRFNIGDQDRDGIDDICDLCPLVGDADQQIDSDDDGLGDACDNCPDRVNPKQEDFDEDGVGDACDACDFRLGDRDGDGVGDACDLCPDNPDLDQADQDGDGIGDACDNCPAVRNQSLDDSDGDGIGDNCDACPNRNAVYFYREQLDLNRVGEELQMCHPECVNGYFQQNEREAMMWMVARSGWSAGLDSCSIPIDLPRGRLPNMHDLDGDGVPNAKDNCVYIFNPSPGVDQLQNDDSDHDGSGDPCDCPNAGPRDDCDNDGRPNRFDRQPQNRQVSDNNNLRQWPDSVYDPQAPYIARWDNLKLAQEVEGMADAPPIGEAAPGAVERRQHCGMDAHVFPGPNPCDDMGDGHREVTVILPGVTPPPTTVGGISEFCTQEVGRVDYRTASIFESHAKLVVQLNDELRAIHGRDKLDFVVGSGGIVHLECYFLGGAAPEMNIAAGQANVIPNEAGNIGTFFFGQTHGLSVVPKYERRPDPAEFSVPAGVIHQLAPLNVVAEAPEGGRAGANVAPLPAFNIGKVPRFAASRVEAVPAAGVQAGTRRFNINGNVMFKVLSAADNLQAEGLAAAANVGPQSSVVVVDIRGPEEVSDPVPILERLEKFYNSEKLKAGVEQNAKAGKISFDLVDGVDWKDPAILKFVIAQSVIPQAAQAARQAGIVQPRIGAAIAPPAPQAGAQGGGVVVEGVIDAEGGNVPPPQPQGAAGAAVEEQEFKMVEPAIIHDPARLSAVGGGCGCNFGANTIPPYALLILFLLLLSPVPLLLVYRKRERKRR